MTLFVYMLTVTCIDKKKNCLSTTLKGVFAKNEREYRLTAKNNRF